MAKRKPRQIDYESLSSRDLVWLFQVDGDLEAQERLLARKDEVIRRLVQNCVRKYTFVDPDDLYQSVVLNFMKVVKTFRPGKKTTSGKENDWDKYCYHRLVFMIKDILRQRDDLGIGWPQKKHYPEWFHIYDKSDASDGCYADLITDHREQPDDEPDISFRDLIDEVRRTLGECTRQCFSVESNRAAKHEDRPNAWSGDSTGGKYYWFEPVPSTTQKRLRRPQQNLWQWSRSRKKPKQVMLFVK